MSTIKSLGYLGLGARSWRLSLPTRPILLQGRDICVAEPSGFGTGELNGYSN